MGWQLTLGLILLVGLAACGPAAAPTPKIPDRITQVTPRPTYTLYPTFTPVPTFTIEELRDLIGEAPTGTTGAGVATPELVATLEPVATATPTAEPTATPLPSPTLIPTKTPRPPKYQSVLGSASDTSDQIPTSLDFQHFAIRKNALAITAVLTTNLNPTELQIWQTDEDELRNCSTARPIALVAPNQTGRSSISWLHCVNAKTRLAHRVELIPWVKPLWWTYVERPRPNTARGQAQPRIWDWKVDVDLDVGEVWELEFRDPLGYAVIIFSGDKIIARVWVDF